MTKAQGATADVFLTALKALPKGQRDAVVVRIARDRAFRRDILDLALITERRSEPSRPFCEYAAVRSAHVLGVLDWREGRYTAPRKR